MPSFQREHIVFTDRTRRLPYTSSIPGRNKVVPRTEINRREHGEHILDIFNSAVETFTTDEVQDFVYLVFRSPVDFFLDLDKFNAKDFRLTSYRRKEVIEGELHRFYYEATVYLNRRAISKFLRKIEQYLTQETSPRFNEDGSVRSPGGKPKNQTLISTIEDIRAATLESFWQEPELPFPSNDSEIWWEVWLAREPGDNSENPIASINEFLTEAGVQISEKYLKFPEHWVYLMRGSVAQLGSSILYTDKLAELRKPRETAEFFVNLSDEESNWISDLRARVDQQVSNITVCLLDTGVNRTHPLLNDIVLERNLDTVNPAWTKADNHPQGHGTGMAGLTIYGDLTEVLSHSNRIQIYHNLESIVLINRSAPHTPESYGIVTQEAIDRGILLNPAHKRIVCMAVTADHADNGRPSSWSSAVDQKIYGSIEEPNDKLLFFISSGNIAEEERINYPLINDSSSIADPAQAFNAIVVGAYTLKDQINIAAFPGATIISPRGGMSPCSTTSINWDNDWCRKPDIVMEGGNSALQNGDLLQVDSLQLLTTSKGGVGRSLLTTFADTSASTALASKFAAELYYHYPELWPETIRGLIVHSADWTPAMLNNRTIGQLSSEEKIRLLQRVGYGVPNLIRARYSANNSLSLIAQRTLKPFRLDGSTVKTEEFHLFDLPWPRETLLEMSDTIVKLKVSLSYFIEPNPGSRKYELSASYRSCGLRFKMIGRNESLRRFEGRISKASRDEDFRSEGEESWILGAQARNKGSIHKDIWQGTAADLATRDKIAVYPVNGWWRSRKLLERYENTIRYSLIITIEAPDIDIDIYTPVSNTISISPTL